MVKSLTKKQQDLIEQNHNLIYGFANRMKLSIEDYYDILAIGMCKAASIFDETKGEFSTVAFRCMKIELLHYWNSQKKKSAIPSNMIVSYDINICKVMGDSYEKENKFLDIFSDKNSTHEIVISNIMLREFFDMLTQEEKHIAKLLLEGVTQSEIADRTNHSRQYIYNYVKKIRRRLNTYLNKN